MVGHVHLHTALLVRQRHHGAHIVLRHVQMHGHDGLAHFVLPPVVRHFGGVFHHPDLAIDPNYLVHHAGCCGDQVLVKLTLQALLHDLHVQQTQKSAAKTKPEGLGHFRLVVQ